MTFKLGLCVISATVLLGCSANDGSAGTSADSSPTPSQSATSSPDASQTTTTTPDPTEGARTVDGAQPIGDRATVLARMPYLTRPDQETSLADLHGREVLLDTREFTGELGVSQAHLSVWRISKSGLAKTGDVPTLPTDTPQNALNAGLSGRYAVWMEDGDTELTVSRWHLMANDRRTGITRELTKAPRMDDGNPAIMPPGWTGAVIRSDQVYWAQVSGSFGREIVDIWGCKISNCRPSQVLPASAFPATSSAGLFTIGSPRFTGTQGYGDEFTVQLLRPGSTVSEVVATVPLQPGESPFGLAAGPGAVSWVVDGAPDRITIHELDTGDETTFVSSSTGGFGYPVVTRDAVLWVETTGPQEIGGYVYDRAQDDVMTIGNKLGVRDIGGDGSLIYWQEAKQPRARPEDISYVIATLR